MQAPSAALPLIEIKDIADYFLTPDARAGRRLRLDVDLRAAMAPLLAPVDAPYDGRHDAR